VAQNGDAVTYCFVVTNTGDIYLFVAEVADSTLGVNVPANALLAPNQSVTVFYEGVVNGDLTNMASVSGNPTDENGDDLSNVANVGDSDTAEKDQ
jgi:hypothetical protein